MNHFGNININNEADAKQKKFMEDLLLFVPKSYMFISIVESQWLMHLVMHKNPQVMFQNQKQMVQHVSLH
jgi:hypothetical protein